MLFQEISNDSSVEKFRKENSIFIDKKINKLYSDIKKNEC